MTREEWAEFDRSIAASVARQEAAVARQEEAAAELEVLSARNARQFQRDGELLADIKSEMREARDERRAMIEALMRVIDRLPPKAGEN